GNSADQVPFLAPGLERQNVSPDRQRQIVAAKRDGFFSGLEQNRFPAGFEKTFDRLLDLGGVAGRSTHWNSIIVAVLLERLERVEARIVEAVRRAGRPRDEVTLIAVTKKFPAAAIRG